MHEKEADILLDDRSTTQDSNTKAATLQWELHSQSENDAIKIDNDTAYNVYTRACCSDWLSKA